jgi:hypothetical protein
MGKSYHNLDTHEDLNAVIMIGCGLFVILAATLVFAGLRWVLFG